MKIKRLEIKGYKSIGHLVLEDVPSLMMLAGANGAGKSNLVEALAFFGSVIQKGLKVAVDEFGKWEDLIFKSNDGDVENGNIGLGIVFEIQKITYHYDLKIRLGKIINRIEYEVLYKDGESIFSRTPSDDYQETENKENPEENDEEIITAILGGVIGGVASKNIGGVLIGGLLGAAFSQIKKENNSKTNINFSNDLSLLHTSFQDITLYRLLTNIKVFKIDPVLSKIPSASTAKNNELNPNGNNIAAVLAQLEKDDDFRETLMEWLELIVPQMQKINASSNRLDGSVGLSFTEASGKQFPAHLISDGTIYVICILTAILSRCNDYGITIIEEPERGIHPKAIGEIIGFIRDKMAESGKHTVILTTHSESVVRNSEVEELFFVQQENGATQVKSLRNSNVDKKKIPLDTAWLTNLLGGGLPW